MASSNASPPPDNQAPTTPGSTTASGKNHGRRRKNRPRGKNDAFQDVAMNGATDQTDQVEDGTANGQGVSDGALPTKTGFSGKESNATKGRGKNRRRMKGRGKGESGDAKAKDAEDESSFHEKEDYKSLDAAFTRASTLVRPTLRVHVASPSTERYSKVLKHDDAVIVPEMFGPQDDWGLYHKLLEEISKLQQDEVEGSEWTSWHEGANLIVKNPKGSKTFQEIVDKVCHYFDIDKDTIFTRLNWYKDSTHWKPFRHDSAAFNKERAKRQNISVSVSFGASRELAFLRARGNGPQSTANADEDPTLIYFPQHNNSCFTFGRDVNINFKNGINALPSNEQDGKGSLSLSLWGLAKNVIEEEGSPTMFGAEGKAAASTPKSNTKIERNRRRNLRRKKKRLAERLLHHQQQILLAREGKDEADSIAGESDVESEVEDGKQDQVQEEVSIVPIEIEEEELVVDLETEKMPSEVMGAPVEMEEEVRLLEEEKIPNDVPGVSLEREEIGGGVDVEVEKNIMHC